MLSIESHGVGTRVWTFAHHTLWTWLTEARHFVIGFRRPDFTLGSCAAMEEARLAHAGTDVHRGHGSSGEMRVDVCALLAGDARLLRLVLTEAAELALSLRRLVHELARWAGITLIATTTTSHVSWLAIPTRSLAVVRR
jgi:hypothetical protein